MTGSTPGSAGRPVTPVVPPPAAEPTERHPVTVVVNGVEVAAEVEARLLLTDFIRHRLRLTGTHVGCEQGACGACTVLLDGRPVRSCLLLAVQVDGSDLRTVEGLAGPDGALSAVQQAFADQHGLQCGFCTPGFVVSLSSLVDRRDRGEPIDEADLDEHLDSSLCRCTGYVNIRRAARQALGFGDGGGADGAGRSDG